MIAVILVALGVLLVTLPGVVAAHVRLPAEEWARLVRASLLAGFASIECGLVLLALPTILHSLHAAGFAEICERVLVPLAPGGEWIGWLSGMTAAAIGVRAWYAGRDARRRGRSVAVEPWLGRHEDRGDFELVVLPTQRLLAVSVPAAQPQVLISDGLVDCLAPDELEAVIRHEATHHRFRHWRYLLVATCVERGLWPLPLVSHSADTMRVALELWADDVAAGGSPSGRARLRQAMIALVGKPDGRAPHRFPRIASERLYRLSRRERVWAVPARLLVHAPVLLLTFGALALVGSWVFGAHHAMALAGYCPG